LRATVFHRHTVDFTGTSIEIHDEPAVRRDEQTSPEIGGILKQLIDEQVGVPADGPQWRATDGE
jgi:hypothetical protein